MVQSWQSTTDEVHIAVWDSTGVITGTPNTLLEKFTYASKANNGKTAQGAGNYYPQIILDQSNFVYWGAHETAVYDVSANQAASGGNIAGSGNAGSDSTTTFDLFAEPTSYTLAKGAETLGASSGEIITGLQEFADTETVQIDYLLQGPGDIANKSNTQAVAASVLAIASSRKDCVGFLSPYRGDVVGVTNSATQTTNVVDFYTSLQSTSFGVYDNTRKYIY